MILFCNGAPKHASFFPMFILGEACRQRGLPYTSGMGKQILHNHRLRAAKKLLAELDAKPEERFLLKGHWGSIPERDALLSFATLKTVLIWRDLRDALVSQYLFDINKFGLKHPPFDAYYWGRSGGRENLVYQLRYRRVWQEVAGHERVHFTDFARLKSDFAAEAGRLLDFAGIEGVDFEDLKRRTSIENVRKISGDAKGAHFRKGKTGGYAEHIRSQAVLDDIAALEAMACGKKSGTLRHELKAFGNYPEKRWYFLNRLIRTAKRGRLFLNSLR